MGSKGHFGLKLGIIDLLLKTRRLLLVCQSCHGDHTVTNWTPWMNVIEFFWKEKEISVKNTNVYNMGLKNIYNQIE